ncbi:beta-galactosidase [Maritalea porphyrae]|uniref:Beta-galactosidase n=1 Tax=Maritalea porphyrae TaxID=880732 RepID=A0ABQ5UQH3_9HYPH|nr:beta-galactosidase [Maritalea porphyrae]GLQ17124.1 beta-galactosidase [Maritalea porphyrae]
MLELGVCYYPEQWPEEMWADDARKMVELGLKWVRIAEFTWSLVEPSEGEFNWGWLDRAVKVLGDAGLQVVMCTPTAAPPKWLVDKHPEILPVDESGNVRKFGARRHYCFSSDIYREHAVRIARAFAQRYGQNPYVHAWQIDNEYGDHNTIYSYSAAAQSAFQQWLAGRYESIEALNKAWGTVFWGMAYKSFSQIELPNGLVEEPSPTHLLDFYRFSSDQVVRFNKAQVDVLRELSPGRPVTHNFMGHNTDFDHYKVGEDIDFASWDSYPMGALVYAGMSDDDKARLLRVGIPDQPAFNNDLYRQVGRGKAWIMEQQPGPVNWAKHNQAPQDGMVRLWTWLAFAHGVDVVCYFRWRQSKFAQEQFHAGLLLPNSEPDRAYLEVAQITKEMAALPEPGERQKAQVALVLDYTSRWAAETLPQGADYSSARVAMDWYSALSARGLDLDIVGPHSDLAGYQLVIVPDMVVDNPDFVEKLTACDAKVYLGARTGSKTADMHIPDNLPPGSFSQLVNVQVNRVESLPSYAGDRVRIGDIHGPVGNWREHIVTSENVIAHFMSDYRDNDPALVGNDKCWYGATHFTPDLLAEVVERLAGWAGVELGQQNATTLRTARRGALNFAFNFGGESVELDVSEDVEFFVGSKTVPSFDVAIWRA